MLDASFKGTNRGNAWLPGLAQLTLCSHSTCSSTAVLGLSGSDKLDLSLWKANIADRWDSLTEPIKIALIGGCFDVWVFSKRCWPMGQSPPRLQ
eukprot:1161361-Pelagomonas_calceolata.AAC.14